MITYKGGNIKMSFDDEDWKKQFDKIKIVQTCPKCGNLGLKYFEGKIRCSECGFEQSVKTL
jgi:hypothetical protein